MRRGRMNKRPQILASRKGSSSQGHFLETFRGDCSLLFVEDPGIIQNFLGAISELLTGDEIGLRTSKSAKFIDAVLRFR